MAIGTSRQVARVETVSSQQLGLFIVYDDCVAMTPAKPHERPLAIIGIQMFFERDIIQNDLSSLRGVGDKFSRVIHPNESRASQPWVF